MRNRLIRSPEKLFRPSAILFLYIFASFDIHQLSSKQLYGRIQSQLTLTECQSKKEVRMYSNNEHERIRCILNIFDRYIQQTELVSFLYLPSIGFACITTLPDVHSFPINDAEHLCRILIQSMAIDILTKRHSRTKNPLFAANAAKTEIRKSLQPYLRRIPEFRYLLNEMLQD